ncbi:DUF3874 domain-containing protein [uncultured Bacteroides sp.]|uniref:DUF3874 domain-containing protein n=1 Tax=uncultured Bacteroides sp. TaxID=162156 RepID=UPI002613AF6A|nr:DUF3874 domain-containing protein [uncultured Bacteroides sp.]
MAGERYWFTTEDEQEIQTVNQSFYQVHPEEELFQIHFRAAQPDDAFELLSLVEIVDELRNLHRGFLSNLNLRRFSAMLVAAGVERIHTREGNRYKVVRIGEGCEG